MKLCVCFHTLDGWDVRLDPKIVCLIAQCADGTVEVRASIGPRERKVYKTAEPYEEIVRKVKEHRSHL